MMRGADLVPDCTLERRQSVLGRRGPTDELTEWQPLLEHRAELACRLRLEHLKAKDEDKGRHIEYRIRRGAEVLEHVVLKRGRA